MTTAQRRKTPNSSQVDIAGRVLGTPMGENDARAATVRDYLIELLADVWKYTDEFDGKRPFGNSDWKYEVYDALADAGLVSVPRDAEGIRHWSADGDERERTKADRMVAVAIRHLAAPRPQPGVDP